MEPAETIQFSDRTHTDAPPRDVIPDLDPLHADRHFRMLPTWNSSADVVSITYALRAMVPSAYHVAEMSVAEAIAAIRDLGMMASSLKRHGVEPTDVVPDLEDRLLALGAKVDMVPRDTVYHYGLWNPRGPRERRFTDDPAEAALIDAARIAAPSIDATLQLLCAAMAHPFESAEFVDGCNTATRELGMILCAIGKAKAQIPPEFFAQTLRPYFAELELGGRVYGGASAAPLSICIVDHLLWGSDCDDEVFRPFQDKQIAFNIPRWRRLYAKTMGQPSLVNRLVREHLRGIHNPKSLEAVIGLLQVMIIFRGRHRFVAKRAYDANIRKFEVGSGGYGTDTLEHLLQLTRNASLRLRALAEEFNGRTEVGN